MCVAATTHPGAEDKRGASRRVATVISEPRWIRPLAMAAIGFVVITAFQTDPQPGWRGQHLAVGAALIVMTAGTLAMVRLPRATPAVLAALPAGIALSAGALVGLQPTGAGFLAAFPAVSGAALRLPARVSTAVAGIAVTALGAGWALGGHRPFRGVVMNELAVVAFYVVSMFARRLREANDEAERLIGELEATRAAHAQAAALGERQRLAREMHDVLAHSLSGLVLNLEGARLLADRDRGDPKVGDAIERAHRLARTGLEEARRAIGMLRDDDLPGPERLADLASAFEGDTGIVCALQATGDARDLGSDGGLVLYRVAQEALTNVRKHTAAQRVDMRLDYDSAGTRLVIEDVGRAGDRPPPGDGTGYGLTGMRERAELIGGTLTAVPTERGFRVDVWVPR
jgi:signal transduction histidine kinase